MSCALHAHLDIAHRTASLGLLPRRSSRNASLTALFGNRRVVSVRAIRRIRQRRRLQGLMASISNISGLVSIDVGRCEMLDERHASIARRSSQPRHGPHQATYPGRRAGVFAAGARRAAFRAGHFSFLGDRRGSSISTPIRRTDAGRVVLSPRHDADVTRRIQPESFVARCRNSLSNLRISPRFIGRCRSATILSAPIVSTDRDGLRVVDASGTGDRLDPPTTLRHLRRFEIELRDWTLDPAGAKLPLLRRSPMTQCLTTSSCA